MKLKDKIKKCNAFNKAKCNYWNKYSKNTDVSDIIPAQLWTDAFYYGYMYGCRRTNQT